MSSGPRPEPVPSAGVPVSFDKTTARGSSAADCTGRNPASVNATSSPSPPMTKTAEPSGRSSARRLAAA